MNSGLGLLAIIATLLVAGAALSVQAPINAVLARASGGLIAAACISFAIGLVGCLLLAGVTGEWPAWSRVPEVPWYAYLGGIIGVFYLLATAWSVPQIGVLSVLISVILGQMVAALVLDHFGALGLTVREISWQRLAGVGLVALGLVLARA